MNWIVKQLEATHNWGVFTDDGSTIIIGGITSETICHKIARDHNEIEGLRRMHKQMCNIAEDRFHTIQKMRVALEDAHDYLIGSRLYNDALHAEIQDAIKEG